MFYYWAASSEFFFCEQCLLSVSYWFWLKIIWKPENLSYPCGMLFSGKRLNLVVFGRAQESKCFTGSVALQSRTLSLLFKTFEWRRWGYCIIPLPLRLLRCIQLSTAEGDGEYGDKSRVVFIVTSGGMLDGVFWFWFCFFVFGRGWCFFFLVGGLRVWMLGVSMTSDSNIC